MPDLEPRTVTRWALYERRVQGLLGPYCWHDVFLGHLVLPIRLFRTRAEARRARLDCCYPEARVVKVQVTILPAQPLPRPRGL